MAIVGRALALALAGLAVAARAAACAPDLVEIETADGRVAAFAVEIADEPEERSRGLMFRDDLPRDAGMLFLWDEAAPRTFWMKNTPLSLDMLFISPEGRVCGLVERAAPFTLDARRSGCAASAVLEIHAGLAERLGVGIGARLRHPAFGPEAAWACEAD